LIVRLGSKGKLEGSVMAYLPGRRKLEATLEAETAKAKPL